MRGLLAARLLLAPMVAALSALGGCAELGLVTDGTSVSMGKPSDGYLVDAKRLADQGEGYTTREIWKARNNRFGTDELLDLITGVGRRMSRQVRDVRLVVADLSSHGGGAARAWHRSHQSGRDVDLVYYMRGPDGKPFEADAMHVFGPDAVAKDGTGITIDLPRTWMLVRELVTAPEAPVQWIFMYEPIAAKLVEYATTKGEPAELIALARQTLKQPGDSARHDDHMHVRVYCSPRDHQFGCVDIGPMELLAIHDAARARGGGLPAAVASLVGGAAQLGSIEAIGAVAGDARAPGAVANSAPAGAPVQGAAGRSPLLTGGYLRRWR